MLLHARTFKYILILGLPWGVLGIFSSLSHGPIQFESLESKTAELKPVFNRIAFQQRGSKDIWLMQQSHQGIQKIHNEWDRIAIIIDKAKNPVVAVFYQMLPGELQWTGRETSIDYKASCFMCHNNGPRAIRPNYASALVPLSFVDRIRIQWWNFRIKSYGRVAAVSTKSQVPFRNSGKVATATLATKTCVLCHKDSGLFARGTLQRQHFMSIRFMVQNGFMPPLGIPLADREKKEIERFIEGRLAD